METKGRMNANTNQDTKPKASEQKTERTSPSDIVELPVVGHIGALQFVEEALQLHMEVLKSSDAEGEIMILEEVIKLNQAIRDRASNDMLGSRVDALHEAIDSLVKASDDLVEGAQAQVAEYAQDFENQSQMRQKQMKGHSHDTLCVIDEEITRRMSAIERSAQLQEKLEDERAELMLEIGTIEDALRFGDTVSADAHEPSKTVLVQQKLNLDAKIEALLQARDNNERTIGELKRYDEAMKTLKRGLAPEIFEEDLKL